jgi:ketopantoate reductase
MADVSDQARECARSCQQCYEECLEATAELQVNEPDSAVLASALLDCAELCRTTVGFLMRGSTLQSFLCALTAEACLIAAARTVQVNIERVQHCRAACERTADQCRRLAALVGAAA